MLNFTLSVDMARDCKQLYSAYQLIWIDTRLSQFATPNLTKTQKQISATIDISEASDLFAQDLFTLQAWEYLSGWQQNHTPWSLAMRGSEGCMAGSPTRSGRTDTLSETSLLRDNNGLGGRTDTFSKNYLFFRTIRAVSGSAKKDDWKPFRKTT